MRRIKAQSPAFIQPKGLPVSNKDAMEEVVKEKVTEVVTEKAVELIESKTEEIEKKVEETADKVLDTVQENTQKVADKIEDVVEQAAKPLTDLIDKLDDNPAVKKVLDGIGESIVEQVDGREFSCFCFGWALALKISRKRPQSSPSTPSVIDSKLPELPPLPEVAKETPPPTAPVESQSEAPSKETSASA